MDCIHGIHVCRRCGRYSTLSTASNGLRRPCSGRLKPHGARILRRLYGAPPRPPYGRTSWPDGTPAPEERTTQGVKRKGLGGNRRMTTTTTGPRDPSYFRDGLFGAPGDVSQEGPRVRRRLRPPPAKVEGGTAGLVSPARRFLNTLRGAAVPVGRAPGEGPRTDGWGSGGQSQGPSTEPLAQRRPRWPGTPANQPARESFPTPAQIRLDALRTRVRAKAAAAEAATLSR